MGTGGRASATARCTSIPCRTKCRPSRPRSACIEKLGLQPWRVAFAGVFFPILTEAAVGSFVVRVRAELLDVDIDTETRGARQINPAVLHLQRDDGDLLAEILEIHKIFGDPEIRDDRREVHR